MSFGYFGNPLDSTIGYSGQNAPDLSTNTSKAMLFVFKPHLNQFTDIGMRPFQYQFDDNFNAITQEVTDTLKSGSAPASAMLTDFMQRTNFSDHLVPSWQASMQFDASKLSDKWRFILVLTEKASGLITGNTLASSIGNNAVRRIYTGYFIDEPFNPTTFTNTSRTLNPASAMVITHKTVIGMMTEHGRLGPTTNVMTRASEEIIHSGISRSLMSYGSADTSLHLMTPSRCISQIDTNHQGYAMAIDTESNITNSNSQEVIADTLEQPTHNVATIIRGMMKHRDDVTTRGRLMTGRVEAFYQNDFMEDEATRMNLSRYMDIPQFKKVSQFDLDENAIYSAESINQLVGGDLDVVDFDQPRPQYYETAEQMQTSIINQYSHLIAMVVVPILNSAGLNGMQFVYEIKSTPGLPDEQFYTISAEPQWALSPQDTVLTARAVEIELRKGILKTIFDSKGSFRVEVSANTTGNTVVRLSLIDQGMICQVDFVMPSCLGGLISPLLGDGLTNASNSEQLVGLYGVATGTPTGISGFNQDDHDFMSLGESMFGTGALPGPDGYHEEVLSD